MNYPKTNKALKFMAVLLLLAGCVQGHTGKADQVAKTRIAESVERTTSTNSAHLVATAPNLRIEGDVDFANSAVDLRLTGTAPHDWKEIRKVNGEVWVLDSSGWQKTSSTELLPARLPLANPISIFQLVNALDNATVFGGVQVNGVTATRYDARFQFGLLDDLAHVCTSHCAASDLRDAFIGTANTFPVQIYLDKSEHILRLQFPADIHTTKAQSDPDGGPINASAVDLSKFGEPVSVTAPQ